MNLLRTREIIMPPVSIGLRGKFTVELIHARTGLVKRRLEFDNLITNAGLDALGGTQISSLTNAYMAVGTGATAPANGDTTLQTEAAGGRSNANGGVGIVHGSGASYAYWYMRVTRLFTETQANGNLAELGLFTAAAGGTMWARQLFKDAGGTPTVVVKTAADQLRITYEIRVYPPADVVVNPLAISGANYAVTTRPVDIDRELVWGYDPAFLIDCILDGFRGDAPIVRGRFQAAETNTLVLTTDTPGAGTTSDSKSAAAYVNGNYYRDLTAVWEPGTANFATGIGSVNIHIGGAGVAAFQQVFVPKLPKDATKRLTLVNRLAWGRYP